MFVEEAQWIERTLAGLPLPEGARVLDIGSSTLEFRTERQPHIDRHVFAPLRERGLRPVHLDAKEAEGVDLVVDVTDPAFDPQERIGERFELVLCTNLLEHVVDRARTARVVLSLVEPAGYLLVTVPRTYKRHLDPIDTMYRPTPRRLVRLFRHEEPRLEVVVAETVPVTGRQYYRYFASWNPLWRKREMIRWRVPALRWKQACVLLRLPG